MLIRMKEGRACAGPEVKHVAKDLYEVPDDVAKAVVEAGEAEYADADKAGEPAPGAAPHEKAVKEPQGETRSHHKKAD